MLYLVIVAVSAATATPQPSREFIRACFDRAKGQAELNFCSAGEAEAKKQDFGDPEAVACFDKEYTQSGMNICASQELERADKALNASWVRAKHWVRDDVQATKLLIDAQRAWLKFRDAECEHISDQNRGGSIRPLVHIECRTSLTKQRTEALTNFAKPRDER